MPNRVGRTPSIFSAALALAAALILAGSARK